MVSVAAQTIKDHEKPYYMSGVPATKKKSAIQEYTQLRNLEYTELIPLPDNAGFVDEDGKIWPPLSTKQQALVNTYFEGMTNAEKAMRAGVKHKRYGLTNFDGAGGLPYLKSPVFKNAILNLRIERDNARNLTRENYMDEVYEMQQRATREKKLTTAAKLLELRGKMAGFFDNKGDEGPKEHTESSKVAEEIKAMMDEIKALKNEKVVSDQ
jgi:hypothetical protein